jgi:acyl-CoA reductase-like NAD-dependent aldehyde dehydrogenase
MNLEVLKTVKMYVGGAFIRSESGRTYPCYKKDSKTIYARVCQGSKKDFRNAIGSAKSGLKSWSSKTAYNRSQILYRMAEMMEARKNEFISELSVVLPISKTEANEDVTAAIDTCIYYAGFCDKYQQAAGCVNPVASPFHNFTTPTPVGIVALVDSDKFSISKLMDNICSILVGGNSVIALVSSECPIIVSTLGEIFATSDMPSGVVNLLSGHLEELSNVISTHMEVNAVSFQNENKEIYHQIRSNSIDNMKRIVGLKEGCEKSLDLILDFVEYKTVWHPIGQ